MDATPTASGEAEGVGVCSSLLRLAPSLAAVATLGLTFVGSLTTLLGLCSRQLTPVQPSRTGQWGQPAFTRRRGLETDTGLAPGRARSHGPGPITLLATCRSGYCLELSPIP